MNVVSATTRLERISADEALNLYRADIHDLGRAALAACCRLHPEPYRTYAVDRNINYSNICTSFCTFCNFKVPPGDARGYVLTYEQVGRKIQELVDIGGTQTLMQGGIVPIETLPLDWYLGLLRYIKSHWPRLHIHAFSPPEIWALHRGTGVPLKDLLLRLQEAGLATIPGGGAEILVDRVRRRISPKKCTAEQWLEVMRTAHAIGMRTTATMMFGHVETVAERIEHLDRIRRLQDETGGFTAFILWPFQPGDTPLGRLPRTADPPGAPGATGGASEGATPSSRLTELETQEDACPGGGRAHPPQQSRLQETPGAAGSLSASAPPVAATGDPDGRRLRLAGAHEYLRMLALARLYLDNVPNLQSSWVTMGPKIGQIALFFGASDMGSVMMEENVVSSAGTTYRLDEAMIRRLVEEAGWQPRKRDCYYNLLD